LGKILVIGAAGLIGKEIVNALGESNCIRASRSSDERVDITDPKSLAALFDRIGAIDGIICTGGAARFKPWDQLTDEDWTFSSACKLLGQVNVVRYGLKSVRPAARSRSRPAWRRDIPTRAAPSSPPSIRQSTRLCARSPRSRRLQFGSTPFLRDEFRRHCRRCVVIRRAESLRPKWPRSPSGNFASGATGSVVPVAKA
jgi:NAD dependent epimerase/dehydratase family